MSKIRTRKRGSTYSYAFEIGKQDNKRKVIEKGGYPTEEAAYLAGVEAYMNWKNGSIGLLSSTPTLSEYTESWVESVVKKGVQASTYDLYRRSIKNQVLPYLGDHPLHEITPAHIDQWLRTITEKGYTKRTIRTVKNILNSALQYAVYPLALIKTNPVSYVKLPKKATPSVIKRTIISRDTFQNLLQDTTVYRIPLLLLYHTGMRIGEVLGLTWDVVDLPNHAIRVKQQLQFLRTEKRHHITTPKTETSIRTVLIDDTLCKALAEWKATQSDLFFSPSYAHTYISSDGFITTSSTPLPNHRLLDMVCTRPNGKYITRDALAGFLRQYGLNTHSFRHTHATQLIEGGANAKGVAGRLGHVDVTFTQNLYTHDTEKMQEDTVKIFTDLLQ